MPQITTRYEAVNSYIETGLSARDKMAAIAIASQFQNSERPLSRWQVLIPVAAHQEATQIAPALEQYAAQQPKEPYSVLLSLNSPLGHAASAGVSDTVEAVGQAMRRYPELDVRYSMTFYESPTIGMIRRDLWNGALLARVNEGGYENGQPETIGLNHDIDIERLSPHYLAAIQNHYQQREAKYAFHNMHTVITPMTTTKLSHAPSSAHPNISKGAAWADFAARQAGQSYEAGMVFPFSHYADRGGFRANATTYETEPLFDRTRDIPGASAQTSPRRYIDRLQYGYGAIWTNETFGSNDECRDQSAERPDLTSQELEAIVLSPSLDDQCNNIALRAIHQHFIESDQRLKLHNGALSSDELIGEMVGAVTSARRRLRIATRFGAKVMQSRMLVANLYSRALDTDHLVDLVDQYIRPDATK